MAHAPMPNDTPRVKIVTGWERGRRYSAEQKLRLVEETIKPGMTVSAVGGSATAIPAGGSNRAKRDGPDTPEICVPRPHIKPFARLNGRAIYCGLTALAGCTVIGAAALHILWRERRLVLRPV